MADAVVRVQSNRAVITLGGGEIVAFQAAQAAAPYAERAEDALEQIEQIASGAPDAPSVVAKAERDASNLTEADVAAFAGVLQVDERIERSPDDKVVGLALAPNGLTGSVSIDIGPGFCKDALGQRFLQLNETLTRDINGSWGVGNGGLDAGVWADNVWYHLHLIGNPTTGVVDALFSTSMTNPVMPAGFTLRRYLGSVLTDPVGGGIRPFIQDGEWFWFKAGVIITASPNGVPSFKVLQVPAGAKCTVNLYIESNAGGDASGWLSVRDPDRGDYAALTEAMWFRPSQFFISTEIITTDNFGRVFAGVAGSGPSETIAFRVNGYTIDRSAYR